MKRNLPPMGEPTFLCRTYAAYKLLHVGKTQEAEDELAAAFGYHITRIERNGKLLAKWSMRLDLTPEEEAAFYEKMQHIIMDKAGEVGVKLPPVPKDQPVPSPPNESQT